MPFGTSTKERLCAEMNNYPQNANIRHHFLVICKRIHKPRRGWTTSVDNPVDNVDNLRSYAVCQGKIGKKTLWIILWKLWMLSPNLKRFEGRDTYTADG